ncbi:MAG: hypothetical protein WC119_02405 [Synergistaceae bacterium]
MRTNEYDTLTADDYNKMYWRFLKWPPEELLDHADMKAGDVVVDLCCGANTYLSKAAIIKGASLVHAVDRSKCLKCAPIEKIHTYCMSVSEYLKHCMDIYNMEFADIIACRQGINYFFKEMKNADWVHLTNIMKNDSVFVFNTFRKCPPESPVVRECYNGDKKYVEVYWSLNSVVHHIQVAEGYAPHTTSFDYISRDEFTETLSKYFRSVVIASRENTDIYTCRK